MVKKLLFLVLLLLFVSGCNTIKPNVPVQQAPITPFVVNEVPVVMINDTNSTNETIPEIPPLLIERGKLNVLLLHESNTTLIITPGDNVYLINSGTEESVYTVLGKLQDNGLLLDGLILTYPSKEKIQGAPYIIMKYEPKVYETGLPSNLKEFSLYHRYANNVTTVIQKETNIIVDGVIITLIPPYENGGFINDLEQNTLVIKIVYGRFSLAQLDGCYFDCQERIKLESKILVTNNNACPFFKTDFLLAALPIEIVSPDENCIQTRGVKYINIKTVSPKKDYLFISDGNTTIEGLA